MEPPARSLPPATPAPSELPETFSFPYERVIEQRVATLIWLPALSAMACVFSIWVGVAVFTAIAVVMLVRALVFATRAVTFLRIVRRRDLDVLEGELAQPPIYRPFGSLTGSGPLTRSLLVGQVLARPEGSVRLTECRPLTASHVSLRASDPSADDHLVDRHVHVLARRLPTPVGGPFRGGPSEGPSFQTLLVADAAPTRLRGPLLARAILWTVDALSLGTMLVGAWALAVSV